MLLAKGSAERIHKRKAKSYALRLIPPPTPSESKSSPAGITAREMQANVGLGSPRAIRDARNKVKSYK